MVRTSAVVVIPVYRPKPSALEALSLAQCSAVLGRHPVTFVASNSFDVAAYRDVIPLAAVRPFDDRYFRSLRGYNELLLTPAFYEAFADFDYMLVYQLDAFVFADRLAQWCAKAYDYVGAPWLGSDGEWVGVGNGGFSLRRVAACLGALRTRRHLSPAELWAHVQRTTPNPLLRLLKYHRKVLAHLGLYNDAQSFLKKFVRRGDPEDMFFGLHAPRFLPSFRVAPAEQALQFAVEAGLEKAMTQLAGRAPFGCHRNWYLEMLQRYLLSDQQSQSDRERSVWALAAAAGLHRAHTQGASGVPLV